MSSTKDTLKMLDKGFNLFLKVKREMRAVRAEERAENRERRAEHVHRTYFGRTLPNSNSTEGEP